MEIDVVQFEKDLKKQAENNRLYKEGHCYSCKQQGHPKKECLTKIPGGSKPPPYFKARSTKLPTIEKMKEEEEQPKELKKLAHSMAILNNDKKDELFDLLLNGN